MNIAFIPVRCGSKSIRLKNIKLFCGKPLVFWVISALEKSLNIDEIIVATDCLKIKETVKNFKFKKTQIYLRDPINAQDDSTTESVILEFLSKRKYQDKDNLILAQATSPLTETKDIEEALIKIKQDKADSLLTCVRAKRFFWDENNLPINYQYEKRPRRQDFKGVLIENGAFYISSIKNIISSKNRLSGKISIYEMEEYKFVEIDEEDDWIIAESLMKKHLLPEIIIPKIKLFLSDVDGTLTDAGMYYDQNGNELKKFNTHDGKGFELLRNAGIKTGIITSETTNIVKNRAEKMKVNFLYQGIENHGKLRVVKEICEQENIKMKEVAYVGDDINCKELLEKVGFAACPANAIKQIKLIPNIIQLEKNGGMGVVREFAEIILTNNKKLI